MQFIDLEAQFERIEENISGRIKTVLRSQKYIMGPEVIEVETKLADIAGVKHVLTCASGTDALVIPLMAYRLSIVDAVFVPSFTFFASAECITLAGGTPVFVDCDPITFNISPESLEKSIKEIKNEGKLNPKGIITVDLFGCPADYDKLEAIAEQQGLFLLEDAAQSFGSIYKEKRAGAFGHVAATSFFPSKPLGCYGDGGAIFTNDDDLFQIMKSIRVHGEGIDKYDNIRIGLNARFDTIQAAVILSKLEIFEEEIMRRNRTAAAYTERLADVIATPKIPDGLLSVWAQYTLVAKSSRERKMVIDALADQNIPTAIYYRTPIHLSTAYKNLGYREGDLPVSEELAERVFSIPMHPYLSQCDIEKIATTIRKCYE